MPNTPAETACHVLVVEDTESHVLLAKAALERFGIAPYTARNYDEAIEVFRQHRIDLIFMDLQLPAKSGYEITYEIRRLEHEGQMKRTPIIALTAFMMDDSTERCRKAGMDDCVSKPLGIQLCNYVFENFLPEKAIKAKE